MEGYLREPIIWIFVRVISDFALLFFSNWTICKVAFANKSSDKLGARDAAKKIEVLMVVISTYTC